MKNLILSILALMNITFSFAADITAVTNGAWSNMATWNLNRLPANGDVVIIPAATVVTISDVQQYNTQSLNINVYGILILKSPGKIDLNENSVISVFTGGAIAGIGSPSETIKIGGVKKFDGTDATIVGPRIANASSGTGFISFGTLPVKFSAYSVVKNNNDYQVMWSTAEEHNAAYFEVERSEDGNNWKAVARIAAAGNSSVTRSYSYTDRNVILKTVHYRIKQADLDGRTAYTTLKSFRNNSVAPLYITASQGQVSVRFSEQVSGQVELLLMNLNGQVIARQTVTNPNGQVVMNKSALKGHYLVTVRTGQELMSAQQVIF